MLRLFFLIFSFLISSPANSASFDCEKAATSTEKLICNNPELSNLDSILSLNYQKALKEAQYTGTLRAQQRKWLREVRNKCVDIDCLISVYKARNQELAHQGIWMSDQKEEEICEAVVHSLNNGTLTQQLKELEIPTQEEKRTWKESNPNLSTLYLFRVLEINPGGKSRTLGLIQGGGTCGNCDIFDINAKTKALYPPDDKEESFRWKGWGQCDYFLFVKGEPIILTGNLKHGYSRVSFITWLAPDGAKRALCKLGRDINKKVVMRTKVNKNPELCQALVKGKVEFVKWVDSPVNNNKKPKKRRQRWDKKKLATIDINLDGKKENINYYDYNSGAGCGSYNQWISVQETSDPADTFSELNKIISRHGTGPIKNTNKDDSIYPVSLFRFKGKPYILGKGRKISAEVLSVWQNKKETWCEYDVIPQYQIDIYYPVSTWPNPKED